MTELEVIDWVEQNVREIEPITLAGFDLILIITKTGKMIAGTTLREAVEMEVYNLGEVVNLEDWYEHY